MFAGHPRLKNDLRRPSQEETGARTTVFEFEGIQGQQRRYITWLLEQCAPAVAPSDIVTPEALELLAERLITPLQIQHYLTRVLEQAYRFGEKPVTPTIVHTTLAPDMHELEPTLTRYGYNVKALSELLHIRQAEVRAFLHGQLPPGRTEELHNSAMALMFSHNSSQHEAIFSSRVRFILKPLHITSILSNGGRCNTLASVLQGGQGAITEQWGEVGQRHCHPAIRWTSTLLHHLPARGSMIVKVVP